MTRKALIVVDYSYDFIADDGRLTCGKPGQDIESFILKRLETYQSEGHDIFFMMDLHYENDMFHPETQLFPLIILRAQQDVNYMVRLKLFIITLVETVIFIT